MSFKSYEAAVTTIGLGTIGILVAYVVWYLNDNSIWVDQYITVNTPIQEIMAIIVFLFLLVGVLMSALRSR